MSYRMLIADDEYFIRQRIKKIICWKEWNLEFVGEAENGQEVCDFVSAHDVDIVLLDIRMPKMSGLEVCQKIAEISPKTKIIILSGYNEFEYAKKALEYGVIDYILKPVQQEELQKSLYKCMEKIRATHIRNLQVEQYYHYKKCEKLSNLMSNEISVQELCATFPEFQDIKYSLYMGVYMDQEPGDTIHKIITAFRASDYRCEYMQEGNHIYMIQFFFESRKSLVMFRPLLLKVLGETSNFIFFGVGDIFEFESEWKPHYTRVSHLINARFFYSASDYCMAADMDRSSCFCAELSEIREKLTRYIRQNDQKNLEEYIVSLFASISERRNVDFLIAAVTEIFTCYQLHWNYRKVNRKPQYKFINAVIEEEYSLTQLRHITIRYGQSCFFTDSELSAENAFSGKIIRYIDENYRNPQLSVAMIADHFQRNASYLGTMFKSIYDITLLQYITKVRMEKSVEYLRNGKYHISEIAELVGYSDVFYFSKNFKRYYDCSPKSYLCAMRREKGQGTADASCDCRSGG